MRQNQVQVVMTCLIALPTGFLQSIIHNLRHENNRLSAGVEGISDEPNAATLWETPTVHQPTISELFPPSPMRSSSLHFDETPWRALEIYFPAVNDRIRQYFYNLRPLTHLSRISDYQPIETRVESEECHPQVKRVEQTCPPEGSFPVRTEPSLVGGFVQRDNAISFPSSRKPIIDNTQNSSGPWTDQSESLAHYRSKPADFPVVSNEPIIGRDLKLSTMSNQLDPPPAFRNYFPDTQPQAVGMQGSGTRVEESLQLSGNRAALWHPGVPSTHISKPEATATLENSDHEPAFHPSRVYSFNELVPPRKYHLNQTAQEKEERSPSRCSYFDNSPSRSESKIPSDIKLIIARAQLQPDVEAKNSKEFGHSELIRDCFADIVPPSVSDNLKTKEDLQEITCTEYTRTVPKIDPRLNQTPERTIEKLQEKRNIPQLDQVPRKKKWKKGRRKTESVHFREIQSGSEIGMSSNSPKEPKKQVDIMTLTEPITEVQMNKVGKISGFRSKKTSGKRRKTQITHCNSSEGLHQDSKVVAKIQNPHTVARRKKGQPHVIQSGESEDSQIPFPRFITLSNDKAMVKDNSGSEVRARNTVSGLWAFVEQYLKNTSLIASSKSHIAEGLSQKAFKSYFNHTAQLPKEFKNLVVRDKAVKPYIAELANQLMQSLEIYGDFKLRLEEFGSRVQAYVEKRHKYQLIMGGKAEKNKRFINWVEDITSRVIFLVTFFRNIIRPAKSKGKEEFIRLRQDQAWIFLKNFWDEFPLINFDKKDQNLMETPQHPKYIEIHQLLQAGPNPPSTYHFKTARISWCFLELWMSQEPPEKILWSKMNINDGNIHPVAKRLFYDIMTFAFLEDIQL